MFEWFKKFRKPSGVKVDFIERDDLHTRIVISLPKAIPSGSDVKKSCLEFRIFGEGGRIEKSWSSEHDISADVVIDSKKFRPAFENPKTFHLSIPFSGLLYLEQTLIHKNGKTQKLNRGLTEKGMSVEYYS